MLALAAAAQLSLLGGEWAGWSCRFRHGVLQRVPESYLSRDSIEWGQIPAGFQELVTERASSGSSAVSEPTGGTATTSSSSSWERRTVRLLPADGCQVEDLTAILRNHPLVAAHRAPPPLRGAAAVIDTHVGDGRWRLETLFCGLCHDGVSRPARQMRNALPHSATRTRITLHFDAAAGEMMEDATVDVSQERQWAVVNGGSDLEQVSTRIGSKEGQLRSGLDAAWVSSAVGITCWAEGLKVEKEGLDVDKEGLDVEKEGFNVIKEKEGLTVITEEDDESDLNALSLAGGIDLSWGKSAFSIAMRTQEGDRVQLRREFAPLAGGGKAQPPPRLEAERSGECDGDEGGR